MISQCPNLAVTAIGTSTLLLESYMSKCIVRHRQTALINQTYRCYYCEVLLWDSDISGFMYTHQASRRQAALVRCTAEHLIPRSEGGRNVTHNIVAACHFCNHQRHRAKNPLNANQFRERVRRRMKRGKWLAGVLPRSVVAGK